MMKGRSIGIVTLFNTLDNYGQVLQYLATQVYLEARGDEPFIYMPIEGKVSKWKELKRYVCRNVKKCIKTLKKLIHQERAAVSLSYDEQKIIMFQHWADVTAKMEKAHPRHFAEFRKQHFNTTSGHTDDFRDVYAFAIGSDQMWSYISSYSMLDFISDEVKRFSIAPSVGHKEFSQAEIDLATPSLAKFDFITVREQNGIDFCKACGREDAHLVLDPTFLISKPMYQKYADLQGMQVPKRYVLLYLLGGEIEPSVEKIFEWAKEQDLEVVYVASQGRDDSFPKCYATVEQWLALLQNAEYMFTNSFHGMALSIIYQKPFLTFPLIGLMKGMNGRISQLAENFKLQERIFSGDLNAMYNTIDWIESKRVIENNKQIMNKLLESIDL